MQKNQRPFVVYWNNIPAPYMVDRFNALAERGSLDFEAWFNDRNEPTRSWDIDESNWRFRYRYLPAFAFAGRRFHFPLLLFIRRPDLLVSLYAQPSFVIGWLLAKAKNVRTAFWVEVTHDRLVVRRRWKECLKSIMFSKVDRILTVGKDGRRYARQYGAPDNRIVYVAHVIDEQHFATLSTKARQEKDTLKNGLGLRGTVFIYVGRFLKLKGVNYLLEAFAQVQRCSTSEVSLLLVGDGPEEDTLRKRSRELGIRNIVFAGFQQKIDLPRYYAGSDIFVFPTLGDTYGLVIDEAMACSLPIISTSAVGEIRDRVEDGANGYIVPAEDSTILAERMLRLAQDPALRARMGEISIGKVVGHTPEKWAEDFEEIVQEILMVR